MKSTRTGLLENVQDGISRTQGSREIRKTKVDTVLWDTLYIDIVDVHHKKLLCKIYKMLIKFILVQKTSPPSARVAVMSDMLR